MTNSQTNSEEYVLRGALIEAAIAHAAFDGWTGAMLCRAETEAGAPPGTAQLLFPAGVVDVIDAWALACDQAMGEAVSQMDLSTMRVRGRVTAAVRARIEAIGEENREAARRAAARLAFPDAVVRAPQIVWRASDAIWRALGDPSTDGNFYSKRAVLSGVLATVTPAWLQASGPDDETPWRRLDARIEDVMRFERTKGRVNAALERAPSAVAVLSRLRYPRG